MPSVDSVVREIRRENPIVPRSEESHDSEGAAETRALGEAAAGLELSIDMTDGSDTLDRYIARQLAAQNNSSRES